MDHYTESTPSAALAVLAKGLSAALERLLELDPQARARLRALAGRRVGLQLDPPGIALHVQLLSDGRPQLTLLPAGADAQQSPADLAVRTSPGALLRMLAQGSAGVGQVRVAGDAEVARVLEKLARQFDPDFDAACGRVFGDVLGFQLARAGRGLVDWARRGALRLAEQGADYLRDERRDLVAAPELDAFLDEVDDVSAAVERAERRLQRLETIRRT